ncbi:hypothetical protein H4F26_20275 [Vibrio alginolyticus]|uniref:hypothetical protein n=1 Tax=Vibrio alginolyticus TaxID=663 RepID=UPI002FF29263
MLISYLTQAIDLSPRKRLATPLVYLSRRGVIFVVLSGLFALVKRKDYARQPKYATKIRNQIGKELWGRCWDRVRKQFNLLARLPKSLDPRLTTIDGKQYYVARYTKYDENDQKREHFIKVSVSAHGKLAAWTLAERKLLKAHSDVMDVLLHIEKVSSVQLK